MKIIDRMKVDHLLIYIASFILLWEWIKPLEEITDTGNSYIFLTFIAVSLFLYISRIPWFLSTPIHIFIILYYLHDLFFTTAFFSVEWFIFFINDIQLNVDSLLAKEWYTISDLFRTLLFFLLLWVLCYLLHYWLQKTQRIFFFFLLTIIYIAVIDTFLPFDGKWSMIETIGTGFFLVAYTNMKKLLKKENLNSKLSKWMFSLLLFLASSFLVGFLFPKFDPQWADPVPFIKSTATKYVMGQSGDVQKIGYGTNDEQLGGPFIPDSSPVFHAEVKEVHYWRVESKDIYTGKGWESSGEEEYTHHDLKAVNLNNYEPAVETESLQAIIRSLGNSKHEHYIYSSELKEVYSEDSINLLVNENSGKILISDNQQNQINEYGLVYDFPNFRVDQLKGSSNTPDEQLRERYTQLPNDLPERVSELASTITQNKENNYEKVKAIESYFSNGNFRYETKDVAVPNEEEDYVDQFLFDTMKGYCDNFSSAMVVLVRSLDIPARWVKGYTSGEFIESIDSESEISLYEIRNDNAHSWVEVYFSGIGWVPFEPTIGYSNPFQFSVEQENENDQTLEQEEIEQEEETIEEKEEQVESGLNFKEWFDIRGAFILILAFGVFVSILYLTRNRWFARMLLFYYQKKYPDSIFLYAYQMLLRLLYKKIGFRGTGQTLKDYAKVVDQHWGSDDMQKLTEEYEKVVYAGKDHHQSWSRSKELWENLIKRILT